MDIFLKKSEANISSEKYVGMQKTDYKFKKFLLIRIMHLKCWQ